ncbi:hypothetical protein TNCT_269011 [Trichonephila clavata]|uniref:Uncharacterized protein n=1 Tax=Trichonephila clavata TaxID=2740835 RepID=A0A8X6M5B4_TRICU|nr:hypothetical protein TNCT_269011 [Trichonephila clavata]
MHYVPDPLAVKVGSASGRGVQETRLPQRRMADAEEQVSDSGGEISGNLKRTSGNNEKQYPSSDTICPQSLLCSSHNFTASR